MNTLGSIFSTLLSPDAASRAGDRDLVDVSAGTPAHLSGTPVRRP